MNPKDDVVGNDPSRFKCIGDGEAFLVYLANPDGEKPEMAQPRKTPPTVKIQLPPGRYEGRWFNPVSGNWDPAGEVKSNTPVTAREGGDWILVVQRST